MPSIQRCQVFICFLARRWLTPQAGALLRPVWSPMYYIFKRVAVSRSNMQVAKSPWVNVNTNSSNPTVAPWMDVSFREQYGPLLTTAAFIIGILLGLLILVGISWNIIISFKKNRSRRQESGAGGDQQWSRHHWQRRRKSYTSSRIHIILIPSLARNYLRLMRHLWLNLPCSLHHMQLWRIFCDDPDFATKRFL